MTDSLDGALDMVKGAVARKEALSIGLLGNVAEVLPELVRRGERPDLLTDQTSAHDPSTGYLPAGWSVEDWESRQQSDPDDVTAAAKKSMAAYVRAAIELAEAGVPTFEYGNNIRQMALDEGVEDAFSYPGAIGQYIRPLFARGKGPFRWVALSGNPEDIYKTDAKVKELVPDDEALHRWLDMAATRVPFQGLPARICWVGMERAKIGLAFNDMVASGELEAPVVIGRDQMDAGSVASPNRETEKMPDGSDAVADWPMLNAMMNTASGATWVSIQAGGGVGIGYSQHAGMAIVCDGTPEAARAIELSLTNDPGTGVMRQADAGYTAAREEAEKHRLWLPMEGIGGPSS